MKDMLLQNALHYPFSHLTNPAANEMELVIASWIQTHYSFLPEKVKGKYLGTGMGHCASCTYPKASLDQLKIIGEFFIWAFTVDDLYEHSSLEEIQGVERISMLAIREGKYTSDDPLYAQLPSLRSNILAIAGERWLKERFCHSLELYFRGIKEAIGYRLNNTFPSMESFYEIRINDVNVWPMINFAEVITGSPLPDEVMNHPSVAHLALLTSRILAWANDYFSAHQEDGNEVFNLALMIKNYSGCSVDEANAELIRVHDADVQEFETIIDKLPDFGRYNAQLMDYVGNLRLMIAGYLYWTLQLTARYKAGGHPSLDIRTASVA